MQTQPHGGTVVVVSGIADVLESQPSTQIGKALGFREICAGFVQLLADTMTLRDLYIKHGWQASGPLAPTFQQMCERHQVEQHRLVQLLVRKIREFGGEPIVMAADVAALTSIPLPPCGREEPLAQCHRLLTAHDIVAQAAMSLGARVSALVGAGRAPLIVAEILLTCTLQVWLLGQYMEAAACPLGSCRSMPVLDGVHARPST